MVVEGGGTGVGIATGALVTGGAGCGVAMGTGLLMRAGWGVWGALRCLTSGETKHSCDHVVSVVV